MHTLCEKFSAASPTLRNDIVVFCDQNYGAGYRLVAMTTVGADVFVVLQN
jgi:glutathione peroxidase-family protein